MEFVISDNTDRVVLLSCLPSDTIDDDKQNKNIEQ